MKQTFLLLILLFCLPIAAQQTYRARVVDAETGKTILYASIKSDSQVAMANAEGVFAIEAQGDQMLTVSAIGYSDLQTTAAEMGDTVRLQPLKTVKAEMKDGTAEAILRKLVKRMAREYRRHANTKSTYFTRQTSCFENWMETGEAFQLSESALNIGNAKRAGEKIYRVDGDGYNMRLPYKDLQHLTELGARWYDPATNLFTTIDPLCEKYYHIYPYAYCAGNPMNYVDPTGMIIDHVSQKEWNRQKDLINRVVSSLNKKINKTNEKALAKGWTKEKTEKKNSENAERLSILKNTLQTMEMMEMNQNEVYHLDKTNIDQQIEGNVTRIGDQIHISYNSTALFVHEVTHAGQGLTGDLAFLPNGCTLYQDIFDEVNAYKAQYAYMNYPLNQATPLKIRNMETEGMMPYAPEGGNNTGIIPVNNRSDINTIMQAYPWDFKKNLKK